MPEGDTLAGLALRLRPLVGARVESAELRWPSLAGIDLSGSEVTDVRAAGKHLLLSLRRGDAAWILHSHLRMEGHWDIRPESARLTDHRIRAVLRLATVSQPGSLPHGTARSESISLLVGTSLGELHLVRARDIDRLIGHLGPDPLAETEPGTLAPFDSAAAASRLTAHWGGPSDRSLAAALLDQRRLAGVGNVIRSEVLFLARADPWAGLDVVAGTPGLPERIVALSADVLRLNVGRERRTTPLAWPSKYWVYGRQRRPCLVCGTTVRSAEVPGTGAERTVYWCPSCQPRRDSRQDATTGPSARRESPRRSSE